MANKYHAQAQQQSAKKPGLLKRQQELAQANVDLANAKAAEPPATAIGPSPFATEPTELRMSFSPEVEARTQAVERAKRNFKRQQDVNQ